MTFQTNYFTCHTWNYYSGLAVGYWCRSGNSGAYQQRNAPCYMGFYKQTTYIHLHLYEPKWNL